jgi:glycosyltransferase involved in cell wall biosynthesis
MAAQTEVISAGSKAAAPAGGEGRVGVQSVSVVVPVYNGEATIADLVSRCDAVLAGLGVEHEIVLVNDGSADGSWEKIKALAKEHPWVRGIDLLRNTGQHAALLAGIRSARFEAIVTIDDDLQNPPEEMPKLLAALDEDCDVVYGTPIDKRHGWFRNLGARIVARVLLRMGGKSAPMVSAYRAFRTDLRLAFAEYHGPEVSIDGILSWGTTRFRAVPVRHEDRAHGESNYNFWRLLRHALTMITAFSTKPLRFATLVGFAATLFGFGMFLYVLVRYFTEGNSVPGFAFLASLVSILAGAQLFTIGVIGEYLAHVHVRVMERPTYTIREEVGRQPERPGP